MLATLVLHHCYKERKSSRRGRRVVKQRVGDQPSLSLLSLCPLKHLQISPLVHQLVQDGIPLEAGSCLHLMLHATLLSLSLLHLRFSLILTKDGLSRVRLKHGQLAGFVLHLKWAGYSGQFYNLGNTNTKGLWEGTRASDLPNLQRVCMLRALCAYLSNRVGVVHNFKIMIIITTPVHPKLSCSTVFLPSSLLNIELFVQQVWYLRRREGESHYKLAL